MEKIISIKKIHPDAVKPKYQKEGDAGFDLYAVERVRVKGGKTRVVPTGIKAAIPEGFEIQIRPRSGISLKTNIRIANSPGTIDAGYRGEIGIIVHNLGTYDYVVEKGDRIAQGILKEVPHAVFKWVDELPESDRGEGGFNSTGTNKSDES